MAKKGKIMKNGISYTGGTSGGSIGDITSIISETVKDNLKETFKIVDLGYEEYTLTAGECKEIAISFVDKVPDGYAPIAFTDIDFNYGGGKPVLLKRLIPNTTSHNSVVAIGNPGNTTLNGKMYMRVLCVKLSMFKYITKV